MADGSIAGERGAIRWGYYTAAELEGYHVSKTGPPTATRWALWAKVQTADAFKIRQTPLVFVAPHERGAWYWPIVRLERAGNVITAELGPPIE